MFYCKEKLLLPLYSYLRLMKRFFYFLLFFLLVGSINFSCVKKKDYPVAPVITFKEISSKMDTTAGGVTQLKGIDIVIKFTDGDGDVGVAAGDPLPDLKLVYQYEYLAADNSYKFKPYDMSTSSGFDTLSFPYRIPNITPDGQYKALDGEIKIQLRGFPLVPLYPMVPLQGSKFRFAIIMRDRANNYSDWIYTDEITNP